MGTVRQYQEEHRARRKDGSLIWLRKTVSLIPSSPRPAGYVVAIAEDITEPKRMQDMLLKSEERFATAFRNSPAAMLLAKVEGEGSRIIDANEAFEQISGYRREEVIGRTTNELGLFADPRVLDEFMRQFGATGQIRGFEFDFRRKTGDIGTGLISAELIQLDGEPCVISATIDVTERKEGEARLLAQYERFQRIIEGTDAGYFRIGLDGCYEDVNPAWLRMYGFTRREEVIGLHFSAVQVPGDAAKAVETAKALTRGELVKSGESSRLCRDGTIAYHSHSANPVLDGDRVIGVEGFLIDITERKRVEENLRRSQAYLEESERLSRIGSWALKVPTPEIVYWSPEQYRIYGFDPGKGLPTLEAVLARTHPEDRAVLETMNRAVREKKDMDLDFRILLPDGTVRHIHSLGHPVVNQAGEVEFSGKSGDVTERKLAEALQHSLEQVRLLAARVESVREEERTRLARQIHDDLGQAWTGIKMDLSSLLHHPPVRCQERARRSRAILELIDHTIESVRKIATELRPAILDDLGLAAAVEWAAHEFAARTGTKCALDLPPADLAIDSEAATVLFRILQEALTNIARHAEATEFSVRLAESDGALCLEVRDNGKGFQEARLAHGESLGVLGMRERALLLGGRLTIRSSPGEGAVVTVWIPRP
jgi:PAS domain S-box-containing protein